MDKLIMAVVPNEKAAYALLSSMQDLDLQGSIELYSTEVIAKNADGKLVEKTQDSQRGLGLTMGSMVGAIVGMVGGPVGVAVGAAVGAAAGAGGEAVYSGISGDFLNGVGRTFVPNSYGVFAEVYEDWTFPLDDAVRAVGGHMFRQAAGDVVKAQMKADNDAAREEMDRLDSEIAQSEGETKAKFEARRLEAKAKHEERSAARKQKLEEMRKAWDAKVASIKEKEAKASSEAKLRHQRNAQKLSTFIKKEGAELKQYLT